MSNDAHRTKSGPQASSAERMLADPNYPTEYEWILLHSIINSSSPVSCGDAVWASKLVTNLRAMLEEARAT